MKRRAIFTVILALVIAGLCATALACKRKGSTPPPSEPLDIVIADFESWETGMQLVRTYQQFGAVHQNDNPAYVHTGKGSGQLHPLGGISTGQIPIIFFPFASELFGYDYTDLTKGKSVTFEFYNNEESAVNVAVGLAQDSRPYSYSITPIEYRSLAPGQWTTVTYEINASVLGIDKDVSDMYGTYIAFENARSRDESDAPDIYVDDIMLHFYETAPGSSNIIDLGENEYLDFESDWQKYVISARSTDSAPQSEIVKAAEMTVGAVGSERSLNAISGENVLRVKAPSAERENAYYPGVVFSDKLLSASLFGSLDESEYGNTTFTCSIFNNSPVTQRFGIMFYNAAGRNAYEYSVYPEPYEWYTFTATIKDIYEKFTGRYPNNVSLFTDPGSVQVIWGAFTGADREYFFDDFRFETSEKDTGAMPEITLAPFERKMMVGSTFTVPEASAYDKYDLSPAVKLAVEYKDGENWVPATQKGSRVTVDREGDYRIQATCTNSVGNTAEKTFAFKGVNSIDIYEWAGFDFEDEQSNVWMEAGDDPAATNSSQWFDSIQLDGETRYGVVAAHTDNGKFGSAAGYIGFYISDTLLERATEAKWTAFVIDMYIEAPVSSLRFRSSYADLGTYATGRWISMVITKDMLNNVKSTVNTSGVPLDDKNFYGNFNTLFNEKVGRFMYTDSLSNKSPDCHITYYIDSIRWMTTANKDYGEGDGWVVDPYV